MRSLILLAAVAALLLASSAPAITTAQDPDDGALERQHELIRQTLDTKKIDVSFDETPLSDVIHYLKGRAGIAIVLDPKVGDDLADEPITVTMRNISVGNALRIILDFVDLTWTFRHGVLWITSEEEAFKGRTVLRIYDVRELTMRIRDFAGARIRLRSDESGAPGIICIWPEDDEVIERADADTLMDLIPEVVAADSWAQNPEASIITVMGMLVVRQTPEVHAEIATLLAQLRQNR